MAGNALAKKVGGGAMGIAIGLIMLGNVVPVGMDGFYSADTTNWDSGVTNIWNVLPIFAFLGILAIFAGYAFKHF